MGRRLDRWRELDGRERRRLLGCMAILPVIHAGLAVLGYKRTRGLVERWSRHPDPRPARPEEVSDAQGMARLALIAGHRGVVEATCLRRSLLLYGWTRRRGLKPVLQIGIADQRPPGVPFQAHAWVELDGVPLLPGDVGHLPFS